MTELYTLKPVVDWAARNGLLTDRDLEHPSLVTMAKLAARVADLLRIEQAAINLSTGLQGGFIRCENCGDQESTHDIDDAKELRIALGHEADLSKIDEKPF